MTRSCPHDALFKAAFSHAENAAGLLRGVVEPELAKTANWATLSLEPGSFVDEELAARHSDLLYSVELSGHRSFIYVLLEHQSTADIATVTSREAASLTSSAGRLPYSRSSFERVGHLVGAEYCRRSEEIADVLAEKFVVPTDAASVSVSLDRVAVPMEEIAEDGEHIARNYRMAHCGTLTFHDADGDALHVVRYGRMPAGDIDDMDELLQSDLRSALADRPELHVVALADGASEMWNRLDIIVEGLEQNTTRLVDFWHVCGYLAAAAAAIDGDHSSTRLSRWKHLLLNTQSALLLVLRELDEHTDLEPVAEAVRYVENHGDRLNYARARAQGLPIGSGTSRQPVRAW